MIKKMQKRAPVFNKERRLNYIQFIILANRRGISFIRNITDK